MINPYYVLTVIFILCLLFIWAYNLSKSKKEDKIAFDEYEKSVKDYKQGYKKRPYDTPTHEVNRPHEIKITPNARDVGVDEFTTLVLMGTMSDLSKDSDLSQDIISNSNDSGFSGGGAGGDWNESSPSSSYDSSSDSSSSSGDY